MSKGKINIEKMSKQELVGLIQELLGYDIWNLNYFVNPKTHRVNCYFNCELGFQNMIISKDGATSEIVYKKASDLERATNMDREYLNHDEEFENIMGK